MIVCHCKAISDRAIRRAIRRGARTRREVARVCDVGTCCGGCLPTVQAILDAEERATSRSASGAATELAPR